MMETTRIGSMGITDIIVGDRHRKDLGDLDDLVHSIIVVGMLQPIIVNWDKRLIAGRRRLEAAKRAGWSRVPVQVVQLEKLCRLRAEHDENVCRKDFTPSEAVAIGRAIEEMEQKCGIERKWASRARPGEKVGAARDNQGASKLDAPSGTAKGRSDEKAARAVGMGKDTYRKAKAVVEAAEQDPQLAPVVEEMDRTGKVDPAYQKVKANGEPKRRAAHFHDLADGAKELLRDHKAAFSKTQMRDMGFIGKPMEVEVARLVAENGYRTVKDAKDGLLREISDQPLAAIKRIVPRLSPEQRAELRQMLHEETLDGTVAP
jgi:ParB-like chromosome segregation protein Spo0J